MCKSRANSGIVQSLAVVLGTLDPDPLKDEMLEFSDEVSAVVEQKVE
jgi:hypothetical protein